MAGLLPNKKTQLNKIEKDKKNTNLCCHEMVLIVIWDIRESMITCSTQSALSPPENYDSSSPREDF